MSSFGILALLWMLLAKRPLSERALLQASKDRLLAEKAGKPSPAPHFGAIKAELATRLISWIHAAVVGQERVLPI